MDIITTPYPVSLKVFSDIGEFKEAYKELNNKDVDILGCLGMFSRNDCDLIIGVFNNDVVTLVHELSHAVMYIFDTVGIPLSSDNSETYCYYMDSLLKQAKAILI